MKPFKSIMLSMAALLVISVTSCADKNGVNDDRIDTQKLKTELTSAVNQAIKESEPKTSDSSEADGNSNITVQKDSIGANATAPVINVYVDLPSDGPDFDYDDDNFLAAITIIFAVPCVTILLIIIAILVFIYKRNRNRNAVIQQAIEANYPLPDEFYNGKKRSDQCRNPELLQSGIKKTGLGILLCITFVVFIHVPFVGVMCLILTVIGIGELITYYTSGKNHSTSTDSDVNND